MSAIAHRGDPVRERENNLPAFTTPAALGADMIARPPPHP
jgi:glycerophosphoryl diester phosphodiesterase